jgi:hypothetical protein
MAMESLPRLSQAAQFGILLPVWRGLRSQCRLRLGGPLQEHPAHREPVPNSVRGPYPVLLVQPVPSQRDVFLPYDPPLSVVPSADRLRRFA